LPEFTTVLSGGAIGVDRAAERAAKERGLELQVLLPDWARYGRAAGPVRNAALVDAADFVVAFWDGKSRGTKNVLDHARHMVKPFAVVFP